MHECEFSVFLLCRHGYVYCVFWISEIPWFFCKHFTFDMLKKSYRMDPTFKSLSTSFSSSFRHVGLWECGVSEGLRIRAMSAGKFE